MLRVKSSAYEEPQSHEHIMDDQVRSMQGWVDKDLDYPGFAMAQTQG